MTSDTKAPEYTRADMAVKVKPLVFSARSETLPDGAHLAADCPFGRYYIADRGAHGFGWKRAGSNIFWDFEDSEAAAIMFAQADYELRILSTVKARPIAEIEAAAFRRGAEQMRERAAGELAYHLTFEEDVTLSEIWQERILDLPLTDEDKAND